MRILLTIVMLFMWTLPSLAGSHFMSTEPFKVYTEISGKSAFYDKGELTGAGVEIVSEIMRRVGNGREVVVMPWARAYDFLLKEPNVVLFSTTRTEERDAKFHWVGPFFRFQWVLLVRKGSGIVINSLDDARQVKLIGTYIDDVRERFLLSQGFTNLESTTDNILNFRKLLHGRLDLVFSTASGAIDTARLAGIDPAEFEVAYVVREMDLYAAISDGSDPQQVKEWQAAFEAMKADGTFRTIHRKWYPGLELPLDVRRPWLTTTDSP